MRQPKHARARADRVEPGSDHLRDVLPELCSAAADYQKAANAVVHLDANKVGTDGVKAALQDLQTPRRT